MIDYSERRGETRIDQQTTVFVEVCSASFDNSSPSSVIICSSIDLSANGIQIAMDQAVEVGSILRICAEFHGGDQALYLVGETKWVKPVDQHFTIGFELYDAENTDIAGWKQLVASLLDND